MRRSPLAILIGFLGGLALGFYLGWFVFPVQLINVVPGDLDDSYQADYLYLTAATYASDQNIALAQQRISSLNQPDWQSWLLEQTIDAILAAPSAPETIDLVQLAVALGIDSPAFEPYRNAAEPSP